MPVLRGDGRGAALTCDGVLQSGRRRGERCGRPIVGFCAPGAGRCGKHVDSMRERVAALAKRRAVREMYALRGCPRPEPEHEDEAERDKESELEAAAE